MKFKISNILICFSFAIASYNLFFHIILLFYGDYKNKLLKITSSDVLNKSVSLKILKYQSPLRYLERNDTFTKNVSYYQICNFDAYKTIRPFIEEQWFKARIDLKLPKIADAYKDSLISFKKDHDKYIDQMYLGANSGQDLFLFQSEDIYVGYLRILKCGSAGIIDNFRKYMIEQGFEKPRGSKEYFARMRNHTNNAKIKQFLYKSFPLYKRRKFHNKTFVKMKNFNNVKFKVFAYIREPLKKLESGLSESVVGTAKVLVNKNLTVHDVRQWYIDILNYQNLHFSNKPLAGLHHIYPLSSAFFNYDVNILLAHEKFANNWENVIVPMFGFKPFSYNATLGKHASAINHPNINETIAKEKIQDHVNIQLFRSLIHTIYTKDPTLWSAMCRLILIDYVCFPEYQLPSTCQHLQQDVEQGRSLLMYTANSRKLSDVESYGSQLRLV